MKSDCQRCKSPKSIAYMHRGVISSIGEPPPGIGGYLGALATILRLLKSVTGLRIFALDFGDLHHTLWLRWLLYVHC